MRNLKKSLCLVLALVFVLGLCTVGVGAANGTTFSDEKDIQYDTAVKAMSGLGILIGNDDDGDGVAEFSPAGTLTRAAAAKMIAYMVLGLDADKYPKIEVFSDVTPSDPATWWAAPYIAFCYSQGIIAGMGDGTFRPSAPVTQAQFAKMLLAACGYNGKKEFEGAGWDQNVAKAAMQTKILKNLNNVDWDGEATREEAALLTFNTMTEVAQVVLSKDTDDYKAKEVNGGNFGWATWKLKTEEGYVITNKANDSTAKGIVLNTSGFGGVPAYFQAEDDAADGNMLGHYVKITYRIESIKGEDVAVVYFVEDNCKEVSAAFVLSADKIAAPYTFANGTLGGVAYKNPTIVPPVSGTYVVNGDGKIVAYKETSYFLANLISVSTAGVAKFMDGTTEVSVKAPAGAKANDIYTVTKLGDVYTLEPCTKKEGVKITQKELSNGKWNYNDGAVKPTMATTIPNSSAYTKCNPAVDQLNLGSTFTLYLDSKGLWYAYSDEVTAAAASNTYVFVLKTYTKPDEFNVNKNYAQVIKSDGTIENALPYDGTVILPDTANVNTAYKYVPNIITGGTFTAAAGTAGDNIIIETGGLYDGTPTVDFSGATFVFWNGYAGAYAGAVTNVKPAKNSAIQYTYREVPEGTTTVRKVQTVWFATKESAAVTNSYIYMVSADTTDVASTKRVGNSDVEYYKAYLDGAEMADMAFNPVGGVKNVKPGFASYTKDSSGYYSLTYVRDVADPSAIERTVYLTADDAKTGYILKGNLYRSGVNDALDLSKVKVVRIANGGGGLDADYSAWFADNTKSLLTINSVESIEAALDAGYGLVITYVEHVNGDKHSIGTDIIYVTTVK